MTEAEWLSCENFRDLIGFIGEVYPLRKPRQFAAACCRSVAHLIPNPAVRSLIDELEQGRVPEDLDPEEFDRRFPSNGMDFFGPEHHATFAVRHSLWHQSNYVVAGALRYSSSALGRADVYEAHAASVIGDSLTTIRNAAEQEFIRSRLLIFRDIFGNPFRPITFDTHRRTTDVVALTRGIYEDRAFDRLPLLADALMDAGCDHEEILAHCRSDGPHVRGCWVVDLVRGQE